MNTTKKYCTFLLVAIVLASSCVQIFNTIYLKLHQQAVWHAMQKNIPLQKLTLSNAEWHTFKNFFYTPNEIDIDGKMFDIKEVQQLNNSVVLKGFFDTQEDAIKSKITRDGQQKSKLKYKLPFLTLLYCKSIPPIQIPFKACNKVFKAFAFYCNNYCLSSFSKISHPPQV